MIHREIRLLLACNENATDIIAAGMIAKVLEEAGFDVENGLDILVVRKRAPL